MSAIAWRCLWIALPIVAPVSAGEWKFDVRFDTSVRAKPFSGRMYVIFTKSRREPRMGPSWFRPEVFASRDVRNWKPGESISFEGSKPDSMLAFPKPLAKLDLVGYRAQAVVRFNPYERNIGTGPGNGYSQVIELKAGEKPQVLVVDKIVPSRKFTDSKWVKELSVQSKLLSRFYKRDVHLKAAVMLPGGYYDNPKRRYPVMFNIPGFGGTHYGAQRYTPRDYGHKRGVQFIRVLLDPSCPRGHHVFADSANNGPVGKALVRELIPALDAEFRTVAKPTARYLTGHSSGGWSSLWVQVTYPDVFGGTWSTAPDPVDFRDFQQIDLYRSGENMYRDAKGERRPLARFGSRVVLWYQDFADMEWTLGPGGQLHSFEAVFSPRGDDGNPVLVWDRKTGKIDTTAARTWEKYDIRLVLQRNWKTLGPKLSGKLHVFMGDADTFYLDGATVLLKRSLEKLGSDAVVEIHKGKDHGSLMTAQLRNRIRTEMVDAFLKAHPDWPR